MSDPLLQRKLRSKKLKSRTRRRLNLNCSAEKQNDMHVTAGKAVYLTRLFTFSRRLRMVAEEAGMAVIIQTLL